MRKTIVILAILSSLAVSATAQHAHFITTGTITYERRTNVWTMIKKEINKDNEAFLSPALDAYKKTQPQFRVLKSTLSFSGGKTLFTPIEADPPGNNLLADDPLMTQNNTIYTDVNTNGTVSQRKVFEKTFLLKDSTRKIKWKITDETREIAGYTCRRANGIMLDSVYVVAFYTTKIPVSGGPESFNGLPGMILGVALPHENLTWFASKVTDTSLPAGAVVPPKKGKPVNRKQLITQLNGALKNWGKSGLFEMRLFML